MWLEYDQVKSLFIQSGYTVTSGFEHPGYQNVPAGSITAVRKKCILMAPSSLRAFIYGAWTDGNKQFVADIDLSSFGVDWEEFLRDTKAVREEQADSSDAVFYPAHAKFLNSLLGRPRIFGTEFFYERYEQRARENITRLLADLVRKGIPPELTTIRMNES